MNTTARYDRTSDGGVTIPLPSVDTIIEALEFAETGAPLTASDFGRLFALGVALPVLILIWGWL